MVTGFKTRRSFSFFNRAEATTQLLRTVSRLVALLSLSLSLFLLWSCGTPASTEKKILYWANPMDSSVHSPIATTDPMGMDYLPVYENDSPPPPNGTPPATIPMATKGPVLYWANPMDPSVHSPVFTKDSMGMDYLPVYADGSGGSANVTAVTPGITLSAYQETLIGVQTQAVASQKLFRTVSTVGRVVPDERRQAVVSARFSGRVERLLANTTGATVTAGQALLYIYSPTLVTAQQELLSALRLGLQGGLGNNLADAARNKLRLLGLSPAQIATIETDARVVEAFPVLSPLNGTVLKLNVVAGQYVEEGNPLYELADLTRVWIEAEVYEQDLQTISVGSMAKVQPVSNAATSFSGQVSFISPVIDPATRSTKVRIEVDNHDGRYKPGMLATVNIDTPSALAVLAVPETAILDTGRRTLVYVQTGKGRYVARDVMLGPRSGGWYPVRSGLNEGERVVTQANFLIDSESRLRGVIGGTEQ